MVFRGGKAARRVRARGVLNVLAVLGDEGGGELDEGAPELGEELRPHEILDGLLLLRLGVDINVELL